MRRIVVCLFLLFVAFGCVDRLFYEVNSPGGFSLAISGHITDNGGPHRVNVFRNFDIDSRDSIKTGVSAKSVVISDAEGNSASLSQVMSGVYETKPDDIIGKVGGIYKVRVELEDGRVYESLPDTLPAGGVIDSAYYDFKGRLTADNYTYDYEVRATSTVNTERSNGNYMWSSKMTFKAMTKPELEYVLKGPCYPRPDKPTVCNLNAICSGYLNVGTNYEPQLEYDAPCTCCTCWYDQYSPYILLSDNYQAVDGHYSDILIDRIEQTGWNMMFKMRIQVSMQSMSRQAYRFWKGVRDQRSAVTNIFQPITGKINGNIIQTNGKDVPVEGIFYASSLDEKEFYILRGDTPVNLIPTIDYPGSGWFPCTRLAPNSTTTMPSYWID